MTETAAPLPVNVGELLLGKYLVERVIGAGGMGVVVAVRHRDLGEAVDDHQQAFARHLGQQGLAVTAVDEARLRSWLAAPPPLLDPRARPVQTLPPGAVRVGQLVDQMVWAS